MSQIATIRRLFGNTPGSCGAMDAWEAEKHPRGKGGKFAKGGGGASAVAKAAPTKPTPKRDVSAQAHAAAKAKLAEIKAKPKKPAKPKKAPAKAESSATPAKPKAVKAEPKPKKTDTETQERADLIAELRDLGHKPKKTDTTATLKQMLAGGPAPKEPTAKPKAKAAPKAETPAPKAESPAPKKATASKAATKSKATKEPSAAKAATAALSTAESGHIDAIKGADNGTDRNKAVVALGRNDSIKAAGMARIAEALLGRKLKTAEKTRNGAIMAINAWRPAGTQKAETKTPALKSLKEFGSSIKKLASSLTTPGFGQYVAISQVYDAYKKEHPEAKSIDDFKKELISAAKEKEIHLSRINIPEHMDKKIRDRSETAWGDDRVHFVVKD